MRTISLQDLRNVAVDDPMVMRVERRNLLETLLRLGRLAPREKRVMLLRMDGLTVNEAARELQRSPYYISHVSNEAMKKLRLCKALANA